MKRLIATAVEAGTIVLGVVLGTITEANIEEL